MQWNLRSGILSETPDTRITFSFEIESLDANPDESDNSAMPIKTFNITLKWAEMIAPKVRHLAFTIPPDFHFIPGQFITVHFEHEGKMLRRSYSIATIPESNTMELEIAVGYFEGGPGTRLLYGLKPGDTLTTSGPFGRLILRDESPQRLLFLTTSTGVAPFRSMLKELAKRLKNNPNLQIILLQGVQTRADLLYREDFLSFAKQYPQFVFQAHYSRESIDVDLQSFERLGYVQTAFASLKPNPETDVVYLCGNPAMIDDAFGQLKDKDFPTPLIRREKYIS